MIEGTDLNERLAPASRRARSPGRSTSTSAATARSVFADLSEAMAGTEQQFAIVLDGQVISAPTFNGRIPDGNAQITGNFTKTSAESLATSLKFGALPISFEKDGTQVERSVPRSPATSSRPV